MAYSSPNFNDVSEQNSSNRRSILPNRLSHQPNCHCFDHDVNETYGRPQYNEDPSVVFRKQGTNRTEGTARCMNGIYKAKRVPIDDRTCCDVQPNCRSSIASNRSRDCNRQMNCCERTRNLPNVYPTPNRIRVKPRTCVIDISITCNGGRGNAPVTIKTNEIPTRLPLTNSKATIENPGYIDLDLRSPGHTAELKTDGIIRNQ
ncbi:unnamed protein product [Rotaria sp. Silwood1]|nr:unnamed protein product [Rotaria sp. Silwood1]CAF3432425.1 unnamed protein product [Rotaria sp. Silwood1]CAF4625794.1 unnamed protein product [Rotaria sp. Silwood1]CAF4744052.1 unnamed protein product [Rotaria sp. Silwood1]